MATKIVGFRETFLFASKICQRIIFSSRCYAKEAKSISAKMKGLASLTPRKHLEVESDAEKLCKYVCGADIKMDGKDPELKPDSEYPDWLWNLRTDRNPPLLSEMDKDSHEYWHFVKQKALKQKRLIRKTMFRFKEFK